MVWEKIKSFERELSEIRNESKEIKGNYLSRFEEVHENIHSTKDSILMGISEIKLLLEREYVRKE